MRASTAKSFAMKRTIGEQVAQYMEDHGLKAGAMAKLVGTSRQNIEGLIKRNRFPRDYIERLASVMELSIDSLIAGEYSTKSFKKEINDEVDLSKDAVKSAGCQESPQEGKGEMAENESALCQPIPTSMPDYSPLSFKSAVQLMGSLVGALDETSRDLMRVLLNRLVDNPDKAEELGEKACGLLTVQAPITKNKDLNKALRGRRGRDPVETKPAPLEH